MDRYNKNFRRWFYAINAKLEKQGLDINQLSGQVNLTRLYYNGYTPLEVVNMLLPKNWLMQA